jgi:O-antigen/teichoic acid export membrane protein
MTVPTVPTEAPAKPALVRAGAVVAVGAAAANVVAFALTIVLANLLTKPDFGAVVALLGVAIVGQVPAMALQAVVARHVATAAPAERAGQSRALLMHAVVISLAVSAVVALMTLPATSLLHLASPAPMIWLAVALGPTTMIFAVLGLLQGEERFTALAVLLVVTAVTRVAGGIVGGFAGLGPVLLGIAVGAVAALAFALYLVRADLKKPATGQAHASSDGRALYGELWHAVAGMGALLALTNVDVVLARAYLSGPDSGLYGAGNVATKIAFWFPQAVAMVVFPRLADPEQREGLLARAAAVILGLGILTSVGTALLGPWVFGILMGEQYTTLGPTLGLFAAAGAAGTLVQLLLYSGIAAKDRLIPAVLGVALAVLIGLVVGVAHGSILQIITTVLCTLSALAIVGFLISGWRSRAKARA